MDFIAHNSVRMVKKVTESVYHPLMLNWIKKLIGLDPLLYGKLFEGGG